MAGACGLGDAVTYVAQKVCPIPGGSAREIARDARGRDGISRNRAQLRYNAPFLARFRARCEYAILRNLARC